MVSDAYAALLSHHGEAFLLGATSALLSWDQETLMPPGAGAVRAEQLAPLREWLREHVHRHGRRYEPAELCRRATGAPLSSGPFFTYLEAKLSEAYRL